MVDSIPGIKARITALEMARADCLSGFLQKETQTLDDLLATAHAYSNFILTGEVTQVLPHSGHTTPVKLGEQAEVLGEPR